MSDGLVKRVVLHCPVEGCQWEHDRVDPTSYLGLVRLAPGPRIDVGPAMAAAGRDDDEACRAHLATHSVEDFLRTINHLREQIANLTSDAQAAALRHPAARVGPDRGSRPVAPAVTGR